MFSVTMDDIACDQYASKSKPAMMRVYDAIVAGQTDRALHGLLVLASHARAEADAWQEQHECDHDDCLYVGDETHDVRKALRALVDVL